MKKTALCFTTLIIFSITFSFHIFAACTCSTYTGKTTIGSYAVGDSADINSNTVTVTESGTATAMEIYVYSTTGGSIMMALYSNSGGAPGTLLAVTSSQASVTGWNTLSIPDTAITAGTYWIAFELGTDVYVTYSPTGDTDYWLAYTYGSFPSNSSGMSAYVMPRFNVKLDYCPDVCISPTITPTSTITNTQTIAPTPTITPTLIGTCMCGDEFGMDYIGSGSQTLDGYVIATWYGMPEDGAGTSMSIYVLSGSGQARTAIYANSVTGSTAASPGNLLSESNTFAVTAGWNTVPIPQTSLVSGEIYWLAFETSSTTNIYISGETGSSGDLYWMSQSFGDFPASMAGSSSASDDYSIYVNYCPLSCNFTPTCTPTASQTPSFSATITMTATLQPSPSFTVTAASSATETPSLTCTQTMTYTATPVYTPFATATLTPEPVSGKPVITDVLAYPNPYTGSSGAMTVVYNVKADINEIIFRLYTSGFRLVRERREQGYKNAGTHAMTINRADTSMLAAGIYFYILEASGTGGETEKSRDDAIVILK